MTWTNQVVLSKEPYHEDSASIRRRSDTTSRLVIQRYVKVRDLESNVVPRNWNGLTDAAARNHSSSDACERLWRAPSTKTS